MTKSRRSVDRGNSAADKNVCLKPAFRFLALVLFVTIAYVASAVEIQNADVVNPVNLVTTVGGSASSDTAALNGNYTVVNAFNGNHTVGDANRWIGASGTFPQRAVWTFSTATVVDTIRIYNASYRGANQSPSTFTISGSNDGSEWKTLGTETGVTGWVASRYRTFGFVNSKPYKKYRIEITAVQDMTSSEGKRLSITEIELYRLTAATFEVQPDITPTVGIDSFSVGWAFVAEDGSMADAGLVWSTDETFATATTNSLGTSLSPDDYTATLTGLSPDTTYWWKIFATNATDSAETVAASFTTLGVPVFGTVKATRNGDSATFSVALAEAALQNTLVTSVSVFYGTDGENWTELLLGSASSAETFSGTVDNLGYGVTYQWFARATATMQGGRVLATDFATKSFTTLWSGDMYVDDAATNATAPYSTPETAAKTIATALSVATGGATIHVAPGLYKISTPIEVAKAIRILGEGGDPSRVVVSNTVKANFQIGNRRVFYLKHSGALVANLTMQKGSAWGDWMAGGNVYITDAGGTVSNCVIDAGIRVSGHDGGGGAALGGGLLTHSVIRNSTSEAGATQWGQNKAVALQLKGTSRAENCLITHHHPTRPLTLVTMGDTSVMRNCTIVDGSLTATSEWCTVRSPLVIGASATVQNVVIAGVTNTVDNVALKPTGTCANFLNGALDSSIDGTKFPATTVVGTAESFFKDYANGDYTPKAGGPLVGKGANYEGMASVDLAGKPRLVGRNVDIGCYECQKAPGFYIYVR